MNAWEVWLGNQHLDTVHFVRGMTAQQVRDSLVYHDRYDPRITVRLAIILRA